MRSNQQVAAERALAASRHAVGTDKNVGQTAVCEPARAPGSPSDPGWDIPSILKILCPKDGNVVASLNKLNVMKYDSITFFDHKFDGAKWIVDPFEAGGTAQGSDVTILSGTSAKDAAVTLYHEWRHTTQPEDMNHCDKERDAYEQTEQWTIERALPGQGSLRKFTGGKWITDKAAIEKVVRTYPGCGSGSTASDPYEVGYDPGKNLTKIYDPTTNKTFWRASKKGDKVSAQEPVTVPEEPIVIPKSSWKCP